jgi:RND family efflux transporter MFP subunit
MKHILLSLTALFMVGCSSTPVAAPAKPVAAAKVDNRAMEADLTKITLTSDAEKRLGIQLADVVSGETSGAGTLSGEVMLIPGKILSANAPATGVIKLARTIAAGQSIRKGETLFRLAPVLIPDRDLRTTYRSEVDSAQLRLNGASIQLNRARQLLSDKAGSQKNVDIAEQEAAQAKAALDAATEKLQRLDSRPLEAGADILVAAPQDGIVRNVHVAEGQTVQAGTALMEVADLSKVWLRVPVYAGDVQAASAFTTVRVRDWNSGGESREATRVNAPPTADPSAVTADIYFELSNADGSLRPGQRMTVMLPAQAPRRKGLRVPAAALLYDIHGGTWVYVNSEPHVYRRQRVELIQVEGGTAVLARGIAAGTKVVTDGAAELFGTEFGAGK